MNNNYKKIKSIYIKNINGNQYKLPEICNCYNIYVV